MSRSAYEVTNNVEEQRFEIQVGELVAELLYELDGNVLTLIHTGVPPDLEGQGIASELARAALEYAKKEGLQVVPLCPFVQTFLRRHPEYQPLVRHSRSNPGQ